MLNVVSVFLWGVGGGRGVQSANQRKNVCSYNKSNWKIFCITNDPFAWTRILMRGSELQSFKKSGRGPIIHTKDKIKSLWLNAIYLRENCMYMSFLTLKL